MFKYNDPCEFFMLPKLKVEPEDEADQLLDMELDSNFEPQVEDLMEEDPGIQDEEWEPEFKKPRIKRENTDPAGKS